MSVLLLTTRSFSCRRAIVALTLATGLVASGIANRATAATSETAADAERRTIDEEVAARARSFAEQHHPELARLLDQLRDNSPEQHAKAIQEISRAQEQLERTKARNPERYEAALEQWKLSSRIRLTVARMSLTKDPALEAELRELVKARRAQQMLPLRAERERLEKRLEKVRTELAAYDTDPVQAVEREMVELQKNVRAAEAKVKLRRPAASKKD